VITRRFILALSAATALRAARAKNPFFALCMDTHDERKRSLREQAELLKEVGFDGAGHLWLDQLEERVATLDAAGLRLFQVYFRVDVSDAPKQVYDSRLPQALPCLAGRGVQLALLITGGKPSDPARDGRAAKIVGEIADIARPHKVGIALYPHANHWLEKVQDAQRLARKLDRPGVGVMFNLCHWLKTGEENEHEPLLRSAMPALAAVSIHGADSAPEIKSGRGNWIQPLGSGTFDTPGLLATLARLGYRGPIGLQCYGIKGDARDHLTRSMSAWRAMRKKLD
jgi:sugar phosphate isomerase/epimerase